MKVANGNLLFELVEYHNLERLRVLRNSEELREFMHHQPKINQKQQLQWFSSQNPESDLYFLVIKEGEIIGYSLIRQIDWENRTAEPGTFLLHENERNSSKAALFLLTFMDFCYFVLDIRIFHGNVLDSNTRAVRNYDHFSKVLIKNTELGSVYKSSNKTSYISDTERIRKALSTLFGYKPKFDVTDVPAHLKNRVSNSDYCKVQ